MFKNYLKIALRTLFKQRLYSGLNLIGLTLGLTGFLMICAFVLHELSYDRFHAQASQIYRIIQQQPGNVFMGSDRFVVTPLSLASELTRTLPEVSSATTVRRGMFLIGEEEAFLEEEGFWADSNFFDVFQYDLLEGNAETALDDPGQIVLTASFAKKMFADEEAMGQTLEVEQWGERLTVQVSGIVEDPPENTHHSFDFLVPMHASADYQRNWQNRTSSSYLTYVLLQEGATGDALQAKLPDFELAYLGEEDAANHNFEVQALSRIHLYNDANFDIGTPGNSRYVYLLGCIGFIILLLGCINYMNLAVARSMKRAKEVGLRQVIGARRIQIALQFMSESVLVATSALLLSLVLVYLLLPSFGELVNRTLTVEWNQPWLVPALVLLVLIVGVVSGSYPAFYMARLQPAQTLKGAKGSGYRQSLLQRSLIVFQYTASIALIVASIVVFQQLRFIQNVDVGYERDHIVSYRLAGIDFQDIAAIKDEVRRYSGVSEIVEVTDLPSNVDGSMVVESWEGRQEGEELIVYSSRVGVEFFDVFDIDLVAGRPFSAEMSSDSTQSVILNERAVTALGWTPEEAVGKRFMEDRLIVGVTKDFHLHSLHLPIAPLMFAPVDGRAHHLAVRFESADPAGLVSQISATLGELTIYPVRPSYLADQYSNMYLSEHRQGQMIGYLTLLAVIIASLGLFGLAAYSTERRSKEIGVRKVLGASVTGLVSLVSREFLVLVVLAIGFAMPLAYIVTRDWLTSFAYSVELGVGVFFLGALIAVCIAVFTVSYIAIRAALVNPVKSLRYE